MFDLPEAKRVRREDLNEAEDSAWRDEEREDDEELRARLNAQIAKTLGWADAPASPSPEPKLDEDEDMDMGNEEFAFRLFSTAQPTQKVVLEEDLGPQGEGVFMKPRPLSYYAVTNLTGKQQAEYAFAAVSGDELLRRSQTPYWGMSLPWKVTKITTTRKASPGEAQRDETAKRARPNKKQRILLRKKAKLDEEREKAAALKMAEKEEQIKDKKKRLNRLKKLRRKAKSKEAKLAGGGDGGGSGDESEGSS